MRTKLITAVLVIAALAGAGVVVVLGLSDSASGDVSVPIEARNVDDLGAVHIELGYDADVLTPVDVKAGALSGNAMMEYDTGTPGWVVISVVDSAGMSGDGSLAVVEFEVTGDGAGSSPLTLDNIDAWDATDVFDIPVQSTPGSYTSSGNPVEAPLLTFGG